MMNTRRKGRDRNKFMFHSVEHIVIVHLMLLLKLATEILFFVPSSYTSKIL